MFIVSGNEISRGLNVSLETLNDYYPCELEHLFDTNYLLVGDGDYVAELLEYLKINQGSLPASLLVGKYMSNFMDLEQILDDHKSFLDYDTILLGTGSFQIEMMERLRPRLKDNSRFYDLLLHAPKLNQEPHCQSKKGYFVYIDPYSQLNISRYLTNYFEFLIASGYRIDNYHPLQNFDDKYLKNASGVFVWNGSTPAFRSVIDKCQSFKLPITYIECGFFPQAQHFYMDKLGVNAQSQLFYDDLAWIGQNELAQLNKLRQKYARPKPNDGYVFVPLQVPNDSNVINHSRFSNGMQKFIDYIEELYPNDDILFKAHPKDRMKSEYLCRRGTIVDGDVIDLIVGAKLVHGINSSVLYEAVLIGREIKCDGDCLLRRHRHQLDKLLAAMIFRQFSTADKSFEVNKLLIFSDLNHSFINSLVVNAN